MKILTRFILLFFVCGTSAAAESPLFELPKHKYAFWKAAYSQVLPQDNHHVELAEEIFERVRSASNISLQHPIRLLITKQNPIDTLLTISLEDGTVVLSYQALQQILAEENGKHKLAFVFGHELAHIENNIKLSHLEPGIRDETKLRHISFFMRTRSQQGEENTKNLDSSIAEELLADKLGIMNMLMAGFNPGYIYSENCTSSFFANWENMLESYVRHKFVVGTTSRCDVVAKELALLNEKGQLFEIGLSFLIAGFHQEAVNAFEELLNAYKGREIYLNLGLAYHKLAIENYKPAEADYRLPFQCSTLIDPLYRAKVRNAASKNTETFTNNIHKAIDLYKIAIDKDPHYSTAFTNISCAYLLEGNINFAMGYLEQALEFDPENPDLLNNFGIASYYLGKHDLARQSLEKAYSLQKNSSLIYNSGVLAARLDDNETAKKWFAQYKNMTTQADWLRKVSHEGYIEKPARQPRGSIESIGPVKPGMSLESIKQKLNSVSEFRSEIENLPVLNNFETGVSSLSEGGQVLVAIANEHFRGSSRLGISIGASKDQLLSLYGQPSDIIYTTFGTCFKFKDQQISFILNNNKVSKWMVHISP